MQVPADSSRPQMGHRAPDGSAAALNLRESFPCFRSWAAVVQPDAAGVPERSRRSPDRRFVDPNPIDPGGVARAEVLTRRSPHEASGIARGVRHRFGRGTSPRPRQQSERGPPSQLHALRDASWRTRGVSHRLAAGLSSDAGAAVIPDLANCIRSDRPCRLPMPRPPEYYILQICPIDSPAVPSARGGRLGRLTGAGPFSASLRLCGRNRLRGAVIVVERVSHAQAAGDGRGPSRKSPAEGSGPTAVASPQVPGSGRSMRTAAESAKRRPWRVRRNRSGPISAHPHASSARRSSAHSVRRSNPVRFSNSE